MSLTSHLSVDRVWIDMSHAGMNLNGVNCHSQENQMSTMCQLSVGDTWIKTDKYLATFIHVLATELWYHSLEEPT